MRWTAKIAIILMSARALFGYLDPGSGSLIVQLLIAVVVGILATFRLWKSRLLSLFGRGEKADKRDESRESDSQV